MTSLHQRRMLQLPVMRETPVGCAHHLTAEERCLLVQPVGTGFLASPFQSLWCAALLPASQAFAMHYGLMSRALMSLHLGAPEWPPVSTVWRPLPVVGKPDLTASS